MLSFNDYKRIYAKHAPQGGRLTTGAAHTIEAKQVIESSWSNDPASCTGYLYSWEYDDEQDKNKNLHPELSKTKIPVDVKFLINSYQSIDKDAVDYRIMFRPSYKCNVPYYEKLFAKKTGASWPIGLFIDLPDADGVYKRWLIAAEANTDNRDFPNWSVLFCDHDFQWVFKGRKLHMWGVGRSQNSYNSGIWTDYKLTQPENQRKFILPYNDISKTLFYNQRLIISPPLEVPVVWQISKVEGANPLGVIMYTCVQSQFNPHTDVIEYDEDGYYKAAWADLYAEKNLPAAPPEDPEAPTPEMTGNYAVITYSGLASQLKIGGSYKKLTVAYYNSGELLKDQTPGDWLFEFDDVEDSKDVSNLIDILSDEGNSTISIRFTGDESYIGRTLIVRNVREDATAQLKLEITTL